jgi:hypothetical protein
MRSLPICADMFWTWPPTKKMKVTISSHQVLDNIYQLLTPSQYSRNNHYDHKMTQKSINPLTNDNPESKVIPQWKTIKLRDSSH